MANNTLLFEVGIERANDQYNKILEEVRELAKYGAKGINIKIQLDKTDELKQTVDLLAKLGNGDTIRPLQTAIQQLRQQLVDLGKGSYTNNELTAMKEQADRAGAEVARLQEKLSRLDKSIKTAGGANNVAQELLVNRSNLQDKVKDASDRYNMLREAYEKAAAAAKNAGDAGATSGNKMAESAMLAEKAMQQLQTIMAPLRETVTTLSSGVNELAGVFKKISSGQVINQGGLFDPQRFVTLQEAIDRIIGEVNRLRTAFEGFGNLPGLTTLTTTINGLQINAKGVSDMLTTLNGALKFTGSTEEIKNYEARVVALKDEITQLENKLKTLGEAAQKANQEMRSVSETKGNEATLNNNLDLLNQRIYEVTRAYGELIRRQGELAASGKTDDGLEHRIQLMKQYLEHLKTLYNLDLSKVGIFKSKDALWGTENAIPFGKVTGRQVMNDVKQVNAELDKTEKAAKNAAKSQSKALEEQARSAKVAGKAISDLQKKYEKFKNNTTYLKADKLGIDTTQYALAIERLLRYQRILRYISENGGHDASRITGSVGYHNMLNNLDIQLGRMKQQVAEREKANAATIQLTDAEQRFAQALSRSTDQMRGQSQVLSDLKSMATQYLSVWGAQSFIHSIIETGGLLEQQRLSIGAILGDIELANTLFGQIKDLALKSPFGVVQLDTMTKQLTAYGFQYKELFDWTKRLADISAATGTEVSRLSLALGHVRAEGALSGYTLRQFSMANVPVLRMLSENLGITTKEVRDKVRKKEISYDDVKDIFMQLTDEGGMFYNAQEVMSQALNAKFKNLRDAFDIMYGEIAEGGVGDALKKFAETLTAMAKHWERAATDITGLAIAFGAMKAATLLSTSALGANTAASLKNISVALQNEKANMRLAYASGIVTKAEYEKVMAQGKYSVSALKVALVEKKLTIEELQRAVALGKIDKQMAVAAATQAGYNAQLINGVRVLGLWRKGAFLVGEGFVKMGAMIKSALSTFWPLLALTAVFDLFSKTSDQSNEASEAANSAAKATNKYSELQAVTEKMGESQGKSNDTLAAGIKEMEEALTAVGAYTEELKKNADSVDSLAEKYDILRDAMRNVSDEAMDKTSRKEHLIAEGLKTGSNAWGGSWNPYNWFRDNALKDLKDIDDYTAELYLVLDKNDKVLKKFMQRSLSAQKKWRKEYETSSAKDIFMSLSVKDKAAILDGMRYHGERNESSVGFDIAKAFFGNIKDNVTHYESYSYLGANRELKGHVEEVSKAFADAFKIDYPNIDLNEATEKQKIVFDKWLRKTIEGIDGLKDAAQIALRNVVIEGTIKVVPKYKLDNEAFNDFITEMKEQYPIAYEQWQRHGNSGMQFSEDERRKSAESYKRTFGNVSVRTIGNESKKRLKELKEEQKRLVKFQSSVVYKESEKEQKENKAETDKIKEERKRLKQAQKDYNQFGDPKKSKGEDKNAKAVRERVRVIKEAADAFEYWRNKVGDKAAWSHVQEEFGSVLNTIHVTANNIGDLKGNLKKTLNSKEFAAIRDKKVKTQIEKEVAKDTAQIDRKDFEKSSAEAASVLKERLESLTRAWEIYNKVRDTTGNESLAKQMSQLSVDRSSTTTVADAIKQTMQEIAKIDFDKVFNLDEKGIREYVYTLGLADDVIDGVTEGLKKWKDLQKQVVENDIESFSALVGSLQDYDSLVSRINRNLEKTIAANERLVSEGVITRGQADAANQTARVQADDEKWKLSSEYINLMNNSLSLTKREVESGLIKAQDILNKKLDSGVISAQEYVVEMTKLRDIMSDFENNSLFGKNNVLTSYIRNGEQGMRTYLKGQITSANNVIYSPKSTIEEIQKALSKRGKSQDLLKELDSGFLATMNDVNVAFGALSNALTPVIKLFDELGMKGVGEVVGGIQGALSGATNGALGSVALFGASASPYGAAIGAGLSIASSVIPKLFDNGSAEYEKAKAEYENLISVWDSLIDKKMEYLNESWGTEAKNAGTEALALLKTEVEATKVLAEQRLAAGASMGSHSMRHRMWAGSYGYEGKNWKDVAGQISNALGGVTFNNMEDMLNMTADQLMWIKENYVGLWAHMDGDFREYLEKLIQYGDQAKDIISTMQEKLTGWDLKSIESDWASLMSTMDNDSDDLAESLEEKLRNAIMNSMIENLFSDKLQKLIDSAKMNDTYLSASGVAKKHIYDSNGNILDNDVLSEFTSEEYAEIMEHAKALGIEVTRYRDILKAIYGMKDSGSTSSKVIQGGFNENETGLLLSYVNGIRADVSIDRDAILQYFPQFIQMLTANNQSLRNIETHTAAIMGSNAAIQQSVDDLRNDFRGLKNNAWKMPVS